jgi:uncharacterized membrane protein YphA (DoxX/SURF4 family)
MKKWLIVIRWFVGLLFIFSGLIKANDPLGLSYKMQEFFEAWHLKGFHNYTLFAAIAMNILEVVAGVAVIVGWQMKRFSWLLLSLIVFFTFLTGYVLFSGKIHACGCFGDCLPLTPIQTFGKDLTLLFLILLLVFNSNKVKTKLNATVSFGIIVISFVGTLALQFFVQKHLPIIDCLPYAKGKNILEEMKLPPNAVSDSFAITFKYKKNGQQIEFDQNNFPTDFDSTYEYINRYDKLVRKGTGLPKIVDFSLTTLNGNDTTKYILGTPNFYLLIFVKDFTAVSEWKTAAFGKLIDILKTKKIPFFIVTADVAGAQNYFLDKHILKCDATVIKTAARVNPTYFLLKGPLVVEKVSNTETDKMITVLSKI